MVERRRRSDGAAFWGCSRYPGCRGIRDVAGTQGAAVPPPPPVRSDGLSAAGGSAKAEYDRRMVKHTASLPGRRRRARLIGLGFLALALVVWLALPAFWFSANLLALFGVVIFLAPLAVRQHTQSWGTGAEGEAATAAILAPFALLGAVILHDRRIPGSRANIDHIFVCPGGVFVIETKSYKGEVGERGGQLTVAGRRTGAVAEARREADVVARVLAGPPVTPLIVIHRASVFVREIGGVRILRAVKLAEYLGARPPVLSPAQVADYAARVDLALPPARTAG
jgi:hypothetical protein